MDSYHFHTDLDQGPIKIRSGSGFRPNFDTDPDPANIVGIRRITILNTAGPNAGCVVCVQGAAAGASAAGAS